MVAVGRAESAVSGECGAGNPVRVFKAPRTYTPVLGALVSPLGTR